MLGQPRRLPHLSLTVRLVAPGNLQIFLGNIYDFFHRFLVANRDVG
jgi:hypothetical protein